MKQYVVDAFADRVFEGNPAAVCLPGPSRAGVGRACAVGGPGLGHAKTPPVPENDGVQVETLVPQSEGYMMTGTDASTGNP